MFTLSRSAPMNPLVLRACITLGRNGDTVRTLDLSEVAVPQT
jgi:hypothetical protein